MRPKDPFHYSPQRHRGTEFCLCIAQNTLCLCASVVSLYKIILSSYLSQFVNNISTSAVPFFHLKCQNISQKILFTATKHSGAKNGRFGPSPTLRPRKKRGEKGKNLHTSPTFVHDFLLKFCSSSHHCKHAKFSKVNAKFSKVVDFFFSTKPLFRHNQNNQLTINHLANPQKTRIFSSKSSFVENFRNMEA